MASIATAAAVSVTATTQNAKFDPKGNTNMAVYWGQGPDQPRLAHFCADASIDIIPIAFLNIFPDQVNGGYPGTNFGNQCGPETFENKDGTTSPLLSNCPFIGPDIKTCQAMGKKILLSLGGAIPNNQSVKNDDSARSFAKFLWNAFGPVDATYDGPRPFGDAVVDGFDFDIESAISDNDASTQYRGYGTMIDTLRIYFAADVRKQYYISGSPQCVIPDAHLAHPIETSWFDFLFIQFYNTPHCSARAYFDANYGKQGDEPSHISFDAWVGFIRTMAMNKDVKLYLGLPAAPSTQLAYDIKMYIAPDDVINLIELFQCRYPQEFGGIMVYEATYSEQNQIEAGHVDHFKLDINLLLFICYCFNDVVFHSDYVAANDVLHVHAFCFCISTNVPKQYGHLELNDVDLWAHCANWYRADFNDLPEQHWVVEHNLRCPCRDRVFLDCPVPYQHRTLERYLYSQPYGSRYQRSWVYKLLRSSQHIHAIEQHRLCQHLLFAANRPFCRLPKLSPGYKRTIPGQQRHFLDHHERLWRNHLYDPDNYRD
ncbi:MAG: hypothetical protein L6R39_000594 [Caloplaca ligustica]|nr:MAG: hypothetical protein L6R39_000594 [Caloplaca ligustica]